MTLKEKINKHTIYWDCYNDEPVKYNHTGKVLKIVDDFAIGFVVWLANSQYNLESYYKKEHIKELLEIYKKEKGL